MIYVLNIVGNKEPERLLEQINKVQNNLFTAEASIKNDHVSFPVDFFISEMVRTKIRAEMKG